MLEGRITPQINHFRIFLLPSKCSLLRSSSLFAPPVSSGLLVSSRSHLNRFMENPQEEHWVAVKRILRYLQGTKTHGICYKSSSKIDFRGYSDADWAGDLADRKSTSGYTFMLLGAPVSWGSKKQPSVLLSTSEAEYISLSLAIQEGKWIHRLLCEILTVAGEEKPTLMIYEDNQSCIKMTKNPVNHGRAKHIDIKYHHIRDEVSAVKSRLSIARLR